VRNNEGDDDRLSVFPREFSEAALDLAWSARLDRQDRDPDLLRCPTGALRDRKVKWIARIHEQRDPGKRGKQHLQ
jgi:hypothetical protein